VEKIIEERRRMLKKALIMAKEFCECVTRILGPVRVILYGSYARGDYNVWSDIDVLVITPRRLPVNPIRRLEIIEDCLRKYPLIEPVILTVDELGKRRSNPLVREALEKGRVICDNLHGYD
jgi:predicted nucleotidyltransferase